MKIVIKQIKLNDLNGVIEINEKCLPENYPKSFWVDKYYEGKSTSYVACNGGVIVGYILCDTNSIISFAIDDKYRNIGIGRNLLLNCLNSVSGNIKLYCRSNNIRALALYKKLNFNIFDELSGYYNNPIDDAYIMEWTYTKLDNKLIKKKISIN
jgi:ribosomal-protein-alanine N-acetyltransferase